MEMYIKVIRLRYVAFTISLSILKDTEDIK